MKSENAFKCLMSFKYVKMNKQTDNNNKNNNYNNNNNNNICMQLSVILQNRKMHAVVLVNCYRWCGNQLYFNCLLSYHKLNTKTAMSTPLAHWTDRTDTSCYLPLVLLMHFNTTSYVLNCATLFEFNWLHWTAALQFKLLNSILHGRNDINDRQLNYDGFDWPHPVIPLFFFFVMVIRI